MFMPFSIRNEFAQLEYNHGTFATSVIVYFTILYAYGGYKEIFILFVAVIRNKTQLLHIFPSNNGLETSIFACCNL